MEQGSTNVVRSSQVDSIHEPKQGGYYETGPGDCYHLEPSQFHSNPLWSHSLLTEQNRWPLVNDMGTPLAAANTYMPLNYIHSGSTSSGDPTHLPPLRDAFRISKTPSTLERLTRKAKRTAHACELCRRRKQKCDGNTPCQGCEEEKSECRYRAVARTKSEEKVEKLISALESCTKSIEALSQHIVILHTSLQQHLS